MPNAKLKNYLHLHFLVFIAGFTAILGELITIHAISIVWYRMLIASVILFLYIKISKVKIKISLKGVLRLSFAGIIIALHWITFFASIDVSNVSIALSMFSTGAFFASFIEPLIFKRRIVWYEILFGIIVVVGVFIITQSEIKYLSGILLGMSSAFFASFFAVLNGKFMQKYTATVISFYEFVSGVAFISIFLLFIEDGFNSNFFSLSLPDFGYLFILGSICTAYAFLAAVYVMKYLSPYTVVLTFNMEPIYGIIMAIIIFPEKEKMSANFYLGASIIIIAVLLNGFLKNSKKLKRK